jgi:hypothetical protein
MSRTSRRSTAVQSESPPAAPRGAEPPPEPAAATEAARLGLGWRIAIAVWLAGFLGLLLYEVGGLALKLLRG